MGITAFTSAPLLANEERRAQAVLVSGLLRIADDPRLAALVTTARKEFDAAIAAISIIVDDWQHLIVADGVPRGVYARRTSLCGHAIGQPAEIFCVADASSDPRFADNPAVEGAGGLRFYAGAPLLDADGIALGTLCVLDTAPRDTIAPDAAERLRALATEIMALAPGNKPPI